MIITILLILVILPYFIGMYKFNHCYQYYVVVCQYTTGTELSEEALFFNFETFEPKFKDYWLSGLKLKPVFVHLLGLRTTHKGYIPCGTCHKTEDSKGTFDEVFQEAYNYNKITNGQQTT